MLPQDPPPPPPPPAPPLSQSCITATEGHVRANDSHTDPHDLQDLNAVAARAISAALLPAHLVQRNSGLASVMDRGYGRVRLLGDLVEHLSCHPAYPILTSYTVPQVRPDVTGWNLGGLCHWWGPASRQYTELILVCRFPTDP